MLKLGSIPVPISTANFTPRYSEDDASERSASGRSATSSKSKNLGDLKKEKVSNSFIKKIEPVEALSKRTSMNSSSNTKSVPIQNSNSNLNALIPKDDRLSDRDSRNSGRDSGSDRSISESKNQAKTQPINSKKKEISQIKDQTNSQTKSLSKSLSKSQIKDQTKGQEQEKKPSSKKKEGSDELDPKKEKRSSKKSKKEKKHVITDEKIIKELTKDCTLIDKKEFCKLQVGDRIKYLRNGEYKDGGFIWYSKLNEQDRHFWMVSTQKEIDMNNSRVLKFPLFWDKVEKLWLQPVPDFTKKVMKLEIDELDDNVESLKRMIVKQSFIIEEILTLLEPTYGPDAKKCREAGVKKFNDKFSKPKS